jgi:hypothetical protein
MVDVTEEARGVDADGKQCGDCRVWVNACSFADQVTELHAIVQTPPWRVNNSWLAVTDRRQMPEWSWISILMPYLDGFAS